MPFQHGLYDRPRSGRAVGVPRYTHFKAIRSLADSETMKLYGSFRSDDLQDLKRELLQTVFKLQSRVINLRERFVRLLA
jgi:hypothetical protein